ncbi:MAG: MMPL family transporter [SAR202 cluster bacterium]|nr:MMPL family transporter [SAR202 cluster bacterium]
MNLSTQGLARVSAAHPWRTLVIWLIVLVLAGVAVSQLFASATTTDQDFTGWYRPEAKIALQLVEERLAGERHNVETMVMRSSNLTVDDPAFRARFDQIVRELVALGPEAIAVSEGRPQILSFYATGNPGLVSADRKTTIAPIVMAGDLDQAKGNIEHVLDVLRRYDRTDGFDVMITGQASISEDFRRISEADLQKGETFGIAIAVVILVVVFGTLGAAWIPIILAIIAIVLAVAASALIGQVYQLSFFVINMITMIGLAVGIDYSLFIIARYREERAHGLAKLDAIERAGATSTRAVFFSGLTVVFALMGMLIVPTTIFFSLGLGAILVVIMAVLAALTLLPAILSLFGDGVNAIRIPFIGKSAKPAADSTDGFWNAVTRIVMNNPWPSLLLATSVLIAATIPYFTIKRGLSGVETLPDGFRSKQAFELLISEFPAALGNLGAVEIVIDGQLNSQLVQAGITRLNGLLDADPLLEPGTLEVNPAGDLGRLTVPLRADASSDAATQTIKRLRNSIIPAADIPAEVYVGGPSAINNDFFHLVDIWQPVVFLFVLALSFMLLMVVFRSIIVPVKAIFLNLLSVGAAYGMVVLVSQHGVGAGLLGFQQVEVIQAWLPLFLFSVLFGLSMDYEVFLLSRIRERYDQTMDNFESVAFGLRSTAGLITGAALIMVSVFAGFAAGELVMFQQMGFGLGVAVLVDATIVRSILVPATMRLLGPRNWWLPSFLQWLPDFRVEPQREPERTVPQPASVRAPAGAAK